MYQRVHHTKIGDAGGVPLQQRWDPSVRAAHYTKIGDAGVRRRGLCYSLGSLRPTLRDWRDDEQRGSPYDAKFNVAEIGAVNMGEIGAVRKRSR